MKKKIFSFIMALSFLNGLFCVGVSAHTCDTFYCRGATNFGDMLNEDLLRFFEVNFNNVHISKAKDIFIGSVLDFGFRENINVFGSGFIKKPSEKFKFHKGINPYCLRGKKTKEYVSKITGKNLDNCLLGDPGLLCSRIYPQNESKIYDVGIICHLLDKNSPYLKNIKLKNKKYTFIDVQAPTQEVCKKINQCKFILSSAMHGLIVSDSYGIPNQRIILTDNNHCFYTRLNFKFDDYYSIYENVRVPKAIDLKHSTITDNDIDRFKDNYNIPQDVISKFCDEYTELMKAHFKKEEI